MTAEKWEGAIGGRVQLVGGDQVEEAGDNGGRGEEAKWWREDYWIYGEKEGVMIGRRRNGWGGDGREILWRQF